MKEKQLNIRISDEDKKQLEIDSRKENRSIGNFLIWIWKQWRIKQ